MQKTKLGITVGLAGAALYFFGLFGGYVVTALLAGYVLLQEENAWLKKTAVKAVVLMVIFSLLPALLSLLPGLISFIDDVVSIFGGHFYITFISQLINALNAGIALVEKVLFIVLGVKALTQSTIVIPGVDKLIDKYV